jgi:hypothetical protein
MGLYAPRIGGSPAENSKEGSLFVHYLLRGNPCTELAAQHDRLWHIPAMYRPDRGWAEASRETRRYLNDYTSPVDNSRLGRDSFPENKIASRHDALVTAATNRTHHRSNMSPVCGRVALLSCSRPARRRIDFKASIALAKCICI